MFDLLSDLLILQSLLCVSLEGYLGHSVQFSVHCVQISKESDREQLCLLIYDNWRQSQKGCCFGIVFRNDSFGFNVTVNQVPSKNKDGIFST